MSEIVKLEDLKSIQTPPQTRTYCPISHHSLATTMRTIAQDIITDYTLVGEDYVLARRGQQLFAVLNFQGERPDMALSVGFRNSLDKSMSVGFCCGASVLVCSNMCFHGDITVMKKHTKNLLTTLEDLAITTLYKAQYTFQELVKDAEILKGRKLTDNEAFQLLGLLFGHGVLSPRQLPVALQNWQKPPHSEFQPRNAFSAYQAVTEALKSTPPLNVMEKHIKAHDLVMGEVIDV